MTLNQNDQGGEGFEPWGDPYGVGGPLKVVRARAVEAQTVRIVFDEPPRALVRSATNDALNPLNYQVAIIAGEGTAPHVVGVKKDLVPAPAAAVVEDPETGVDVQVDRPLVIGVEYRIRAFNLVAKAGGALGTPDSANFQGILDIAQVRSPERPDEFSDFKFDAFATDNSAYIFNDAGDIAVHRGIENIRKRVLRRVTTPKNAYRHLPGYGTSFAAHKAPMSVSNLAPLKQDMLAQVRSEPDVLDASIQLQLTGLGVLTLLIKARTPEGIINETVRNDGDGNITVVT